MPISGSFLRPFTLCVSLFEFIPATQGLISPYRKAQNGEVKEFARISSPYEIPQGAELTIDLTSISVEAAAEKVIDYYLKN